MQDREITINAENRTISCSMNTSVMSCVISLVVMVYIELMRNLHFLIYFMHETNVHQ